MGIYRTTTMMTRRANNRSTTLLASVCVGVCLIGLITSVQSGPVYERTRRMIANGDESVPVISTSNGARNETSPNKDVCLMEGHTIPRRLVSCPTKPGCRAIQKEGECCPEYQCECERNGKLYENGEKIMDPETPCRVCYCQGGEFSCNNVTCYIRNDCKPKYTPGRCCPEYDNCPPLENQKSDHNENNSSDNTEEEQDKSPETKASLTTAPVIATSESSSPIPPSAPAQGNDNPLGIKIKEITKPEEIRITDEKPKFVVKVSTSTSTTTTTTTTEAPSSTTPTSSAYSYSSEATESTSESTSQTDATFDQFNKTDDPFQLGEEFEQDLLNGTDTNKNVREVHDGGFINALDIVEEEGLEQEEQAQESEINDSRSLLSSSTENAPTEGSLEHHKDVQHVIIVDNNGESKPITVIGTSQLQLGGGSPDEDINTFDFLASSSSSTPIYFDDMGSGDAQNETQSTTESDMTSGSSTTHEVFVTASSTSYDTLEGSADDNMSSSSTPVNKIVTESTSASPLVPLLKSEEINSSEEETFVFPELPSSTSSGFEIESSSVKVTPSTESTPLENDDLTNPEYPKLPEDLSQHQEEHVFSNSGTYTDTEERSPGEPHLIPEWERNNGTDKGELSEGDSLSTEEEEEQNSVLSYGDKRSSAAEPTTEGMDRFDYGGVSLLGDMMSENSTEERRSSPSPKDDVESLKMQKEETVVEKGVSEDEKMLEEEGSGVSVGEMTRTGSVMKKHSKDVMERYRAKETSLWDLF